MINILYMKAKWFSTSRTGTYLKIPVLHSGNMHIMIIKLRLDCHFNKQLLYLQKKIPSSPYFGWDQILRQRLKKTFYTREQSDLETVLSK